VSKRGDRPYRGGSSRDWLKVKNRKHPAMDRGHGVIQTTTLAKLLAQKQELIARLQQEDIGPEERDEIERLLEKIEAALDLLDKAGPNGP
jgi:ATP-dependent exoDNAse (exonuclease V) alpha subunit